MACLLERGCVNRPVILCALSTLALLVRLGSLGCRCQHSYFDNGIIATVT